MTGEANWVDPLLMILGGLGVVLLVWFGSGATLLRRRRRRLTCPQTSERVQCTLVQNTLTKDWLDVAECSLFGPMRPVTCKKACLPTPTSSG